MSWDKDGYILQDFLGRIGALLLKIKSLKLDCKKNKSRAGKSTIEDQY